MKGPLRCFMPTEKGMAACIAKAYGSYQTGVNMDTWNQMCESLMEWYRVERRILPWREDPTPYHVWISEIMLQQTRVDTVKDYYARFLARCPDIRALAEADEDTYMKLWEGLGYYSRVRNLHKAAEEIMEAYDGIMPKSYDELLKITGIGPYTAAAIASIAFGERVPAVDGNLLRVFARLTAYKENIKTEKARKAAAAYYINWMPAAAPAQSLPSSVQVKGDRVLNRSMVFTSAHVQEDTGAAQFRPLSTPGNFNQALMDLGATICLPNSTPLCAECPLQCFCTAHARGEETAYPVVPEKKARRMEARTVFLLHDAGKIVIGKRPPKGLLASLYEFPNTEGHLTEKEALQYVSSLGFMPLHIRRLAPAKHIFSHIEWHMIGYEVRVDELTPFESDHLLLVSMQALADTYSIPSAFSAYRKLLPENSSE